MGDVEVRGGDALAALAKRLRGQDKAFGKELRAGIRAVAKPMADRATKNLAEKTPGGALERHVRKQRSSVQIKTGSQSAGVRVGAGKKGSGMRLLNSKGQVRHLTFGRPDSWVTQEAPGTKGAWDKSIQQDKRVVQAAIAVVMADVARRVTRG